ncbi:MAG: DUF4214 domain-containing protein [Lachnospiraceae bacterium]|nr:DUF4214 domain-containing protein [Lachnospiraceae bacterium]
MNMKKKRNLIGFLMAFMLMALMAVFGMPMMAKAAPAAHTGHAAHFLGDSSHIGWTPISKQEDLFTLGEKGGCAYLTSDIELTDGGLFIFQNQNVYLCLNGYKIVINTDGITAGIVVSPDSKFVLYDEVNNSGEITGTGEYLTRAVRVSDGEFTMKGGTITGNKALEGAGVMVGPGLFTMDGGKITGNSVTSNGAGVFVDSSEGTFIFNDGEISGNLATEEGWGAGVTSVGTFIMNGGKITENAATEGGGGVYSSGTFTMNGGEISDNSTIRSGGGGVYNAGTFVLKDGTISENAVTEIGDSHCGGGVFSNEIFIMDGGSIQVNVATEGGGVCSLEGTFTMNGGSISGNMGSIGGGVCSIYGTFTLEDGEIDGNSANDGGGVYSNGKLTMNGGAITGNACTIAGSGVSCRNDFTMNSGIISENMANEEGGGVEVCSDSFTLNGGTISYNKAGKAGGGVCISEGKMTMNGGTISENESLSDGGGIYLSDSQYAKLLYISGGSVLDNKAQGNGGGLYANKPFSIEGGSFSGNTAKNKGNGIFVVSDGMVIDGTVSDTVDKGEYVYSITYNPNKGTGKKIIQYALQSPGLSEDRYFIDNRFTRKNYKFESWNTKADGSGTTYYDGAAISISKDIKLYAQWKSIIVPYKVEHYKQKLDGTYNKKASETEEFKGKENSKVTPKVKTYEGFTSPAVKTAKIREDGTTVIKYYYTRNSYTLTWDFAGGLPKGTYTSGSVKYGAKITQPEVLRKGYVFNGWDVKVPLKMPANDLTIKALWKKATDTPYTVEHYKQKLDGTYPASANETESFTGTTNAKVTPEVKTYKGFTAPATQTLKIKADGSLTVKYYYTRNTYKLTWDFAGGSASGRYTKGNVKYGATIIVPKPVRDGYKFNGWDKVVSAKMPASDVTYKAKWKKLSQEEKVKKFVERFYTTILDRPAEVAGLNDWTNRLISKQATGADVAAGFINSGEFQKKKMNDEEYVTRLYRAFFDREPDQEGYNNWLRELKNGKTRDDVLRGFINSPEFNNLCKKYGINTGSY